jgi:hypothetical protein
MAPDDARSPAWLTDWIADLAANDQHAIDIARGLNAEEILEACGTRLEHRSVPRSPHVEPGVSAADRAGARKVSSPVRSMTSIPAGLAAGSSAPTSIRPRSAERSGATKSQAESADRAVRPDSFPAQQRGRAGSDCRASADDVNRIRFVNPFVPVIRFTVGARVRGARHERRHLRRQNASSNR